MYVGFCGFVWYLCKAWIGFLKSLVRAFSKILREGFFYFSFLRGFLFFLLEGFFKKSFNRAFFSKNGGFFRVFVGAL